MNLEQEHFSVAVVSGMEDREITVLEDEIKDVEHVKDVLWYGSHC